MLHVFWFPFEIHLPVSNTQTFFLYALTFAACAGRKVQLGIRVFWIGIQKCFPLGLCIAPWGSILIKQQASPSFYIGVQPPPPPEYYLYCMNHYHNGH